MGDLSPTFRERKRDRNVPSAPAVSQVPLIQNSQYAQVAYSGVTYSEPLHTKEVELDKNSSPWAARSQDTLGLRAAGPYVNAVHRQLSNCI